MLFFLLFGRMLGALQLAGTGAACAVDIQAVVVDIECVKASGVHEGCKILVFHLLDFAACGANQVGVGQSNALILGLHPFKDVSAQHFSFHQQLNGVVNGRTAHTKSVPFDEQLQFFDGEVPVDGHDTVQDGVPLGRPAHAP